MLRICCDVAASFTRFLSLVASTASTAGWTQFHLYKGSTDRDRNLNQGKLGGVLKTLLDKVRASPHSQPFRMPISLTHSRSASQLSTYGGSSSSNASGGAAGGGVEDSEALDLSVVTNRLRLGDYYRHKDMMKADLIRMVRGVYARRAVAPFLRIHFLLMSVRRQ
jgi:hypothetical protein